MAAASIQSPDEQIGQGLRINHAEVEISRSQSALDSLLLLFLELNIGSQHKQANVFHIGFDPFEKVVHYGLAFNFRKLLAVVHYD